MARLIGNTPQRFHRRKQARGLFSPMAGYCVLILGILASTGFAISAILAMPVSEANARISSHQLSAEQLAALDRRSLRTQLWKWAQVAERSYDVPAELIWAVIQTESNFNPKAISPKGAVGLMQLMPRTASWMDVEDPLNSYQNIMGGTRYLEKLLKKYDGDTKLALAAYNAGPGNVAKYGGVPPFKETKKYVRLVLSRYQTNMKEGATL